MLLLYIGVAIFLIVVLVVLVWVITLYNRLIGLNNAIENTFHQIQVSMKKRFDMIGQLVDTTKSYLKYEKSVFVDVTKLRQMPINTPEDIKKADAAARSLLGRLFAVFENYPKVQGIEAVTSLQESIKSVEAEIARLRYLYNDQVQSFNVTIQVFPNNLLAGLLGFTKKPYLEFGEEVEKRPDTKVF
ncbi:MAG: LemA family protein [Candidatus Diapherotrites archaeon]|nr:LemA family protein [Candidatus Diapherotrites archaeon]